MGPNLGAVRVSFGIASTVEDIDTLATFIETKYKNRKFG
jgi:cysteine sulfinate desulfinase/cysteine desulfurase-like protein